MIPAISSFKQNNIGVCFSSARDNLLRKQARNLGMQIKGADIGTLKAKVGREAYNLGITPNANDFALLTKLRKMLDDFDVEWRKSDNIDTLKERLDELLERLDVNWDITTESDEVFVKRYREALEEEAKLRDQQDAFNFEVEQKLDAIRWANITSNY